MTPIYIYLVQISITLLITTLILLAFRRHLHNILAELCGTQQRARFWVAYTIIILVGIPFILGLGYQPQKTKNIIWFFSVAHQIRTNLIGFILALIGIGFMISIFALFAPRSTNK